VAPVPVNISNCGEIKIIKHSDPRGVDQNFGYTSTIPAAGSSAAKDEICVPDSTPAAFTLNDHTGADNTGDGGNTEDCKAVPAGTYTVTEGADPAGFAFESLSCVGGTTSTAGKTATITLAPNDVVTCTYTNQQQLGAIKISKTSIKGTALAGAKFSITGPGGYSNSVTTGTDGSVCVDGLLFGTYSVTETEAPPGYSIDDTTAHDVVVDTKSTCGDGNEATFSATDTPLTDILAKATSQAPGGTESKITCVNAANANIGNSPQGFDDPVQVTANGLKPGTYTCTIEIDP
jgi:hypothetical protein